MIWTTPCDPIFPEDGGFNMFQPPGWKQMTWRLRTKYWPWFGWNGGTVSTSASKVQVVSKGFSPETSISMWAFWRWHCWPNWKEGTMETWSLIIHELCKQISSLPFSMSCITFDPSHLFWEQWGTSRPSSWPICLRNWAASLASCWMQRLKTLSTSLSSGDLDLGITSQPPWPWSRRPWSICWAAWNHWNPMHRSIAMRPKIGRWSRLFSSQIRPKPSMCKELGERRHMCISRSCSRSCCISFNSEINWLWLERLMKLMAGWICTAPFRMRPTTTKEIIASVASGLFEGRTWPCPMPWPSWRKSAQNSAGWGGLFMWEIPSDARCPVFRSFFSLWDLSVSSLRESEGFFKDGRTTDTETIWYKASMILLGFAWAVPPFRFADPCIAVLPVSTLGCVGFGSNFKILIPVHSSVISCLSCLPKNAYESRVAILILSNLIVLKKGGFTWHVDPKRWEELPSEPADSEVDASALQAGHGPFSKGGKITGKVPTLDFPMVIGIYHNITHKISWWYFLMVGKIYHWYLTIKISMVSPMLWLFNWRQCMALLGYHLEHTPI